MMDREGIEEACARLRQELRELEGACRVLSDDCVRHSMASVEAAMRDVQNTLWKVESND